MVYDVIIIGSGLGGLTCGYILSKNGLRVLLLEKHAQAGGCLQTFQRAGVKFSTGMHFVGSLEPGQILHRFFTYLDLLPAVKLSRLDPSAFNIIDLNGQKFNYAVGYEEFTESLSQQFPQNAHEIRNYVRLIQQIANASPLYDLNKLPTDIFSEAYYQKTSLSKFITQISDNTLLQSVLLGNMPLYAASQHKTPVYIHALICNFFIQSAFRIVEGSDAIARSLCLSIQKNGGEVRTNSEVQQIICNQQQATAVRLTSGEVIEARAIISNAHPVATLNMLDTKLIRRSYRERINSIENTISNFTVYIKFRQNAVPYLNSNYFYYRHPDNIWASNYRPAAFGESFLYMHQCETPHEQFARSAVLISYMDFAEVQQWSGTAVGRRGSDYEKFKQAKARVLLNRLETVFPGTLAAIDCYFCSSPLTYRDYTATKNGSTYGIVHDTNHLQQTTVSQRTKIPNLFLTGQNIQAHGILGVIIGAIITASEFIDLQTIAKQIYGKN